MREIVIGIDPGSKGVMACYHAILNEYSFINLEDTDAVAIALNAFAHGNAVVCIEHVKALHGAGSTSTFQFGRSVGFILGMVTAFGIPICEVSPQRWQKEMWEPQDKVVIEGKVNTKQTSMRCAKRLHPTLDFRRTDKCKKLDDNRVDATLICDYAIRKNL